MLCCLLLSTGSSPEVLIGAHGKTHLTKWRTLGRIAHESAIVMPDLRTVYTTDDGTNCGFFMFKADKKADLSCGTLYAGRLTQTEKPDASNANFNVDWIRLGYGEHCKAFTHYLWNHVTWHVQHLRR
jgi:secreted PhoX family phosphatase